MDDEERKRLIEWLRGLSAYAREHFPGEDGAEIVDFFERRARYLESHAAAPSVSPEEKK